MPPKNTEITGRDKGKTIYLTVAQIEYENRPISLPIKYKMVIICQLLKFIAGVTRSRLTFGLKVYRSQGTWCIFPSVIPACAGMTKKVNGTAMLKYIENRI